MSWRVLKLAGTSKEDHLKWTYECKEATLYPSKEIWVLILKTFPGMSKSP